MLRFILIFFLFFIIFVFFLTPNINTGDAGGLITSAYYMGNAHPPGYPLYLQVSKTFMFLPFGNMGFKVALISAVFSSLSLTLLYHILFMLTNNKSASFFSIAVLAVSYSYFTQSVIAKFYPLNLFIILLIFWALITALLDRSMIERAIYITAFLLGLTTGNHHTGLFMVIPAGLFFLVLNRKQMTLKFLVISFLLFFVGFIINAYMLIRGTSEHFFNEVYVYNFKDFWATFFRFVYNKGGSLASVSEVAKNIDAYWYALKNFIMIVTKNFSIYSYLLFIPGIFYLWQRNKTVTVLVLLTLILYGLFLAKMTFSVKMPGEHDYYIVAHQYYLPAFAFYAFFMGCGLSFVFVLLNKGSFKILPRAIPLIFVFFPFIFLIGRSADSNYRTNYVPYQTGKDKYSILPIKSVLLAFGDNDVYQGWYLKLIGRYREDNCMLSTAKPKDKIWMHQGCNENIYKTIYPAISTRNIYDMTFFMVNERFYGSVVVSKDFAFKDYIQSKRFSLEYLYIPTKRLVRDIDEISGRIDKFLEERLKIADEIVNPEVCVSHLTDDFYTKMLCGKYLFHLVDIAQIYSHEKYGDIGKKVEIFFGSNPSNQYLMDYSEKFKIPITEKNLYPIKLFNHINEFNKWKIFYLREE